MIVMVVCGVLVLAGLVAIVRWGGLEVERPAAASEPDGPLSAGGVARAFVWYVTLAVAAGLGAGILMAGTGGRLAMRLLAATAGDAAQGRITEADQVVGRISVGGTVGFILFTALFIGTASGALYLLLRRWLPAGRLGGLVYGALLLVLAGTRIDPLRSENVDFDLVGPGWLAVVVFSALVLAHGMLVAALAGRYSRALPLLSRRRAAVVPYAPLLLMAPMGPTLVAVAVVGALTVLVTRVRALVDGVRSRGFTVAGRVALVAVALFALPGFLADIGAILDRP